MIFPIDPDEFCSLVPYVIPVHVKAAEVSALLVSSSPSANMPPILCFQATMWAMSLMDCHPDNH